MVSGTRQLATVSSTRNKRGNRHQKMVNVSLTLELLVEMDRVA